MLLVDGNSFIHLRRTGLLLCRLIGNLSLVVEYYVFSFLPEKFTYSHSTYKITKRVIPGFAKYETDNS